MTALQPCEAAMTLVYRPHASLSGDQPVGQRLSAAAHQRARQFILEFGTTLQRARLGYQLPVNSVPDRRPVLAALKDYQNPDGGFGHGLEPDLRTARSTVIATTVGLQILDEVDALTTPMAEHAMQYLISQFQTGQWQAIHAGANDAPHAPWWRYETESGSRFSANPSVEIIRYLLSCELMPAETAGLLSKAITYIRSTPLDMHELQCYQRLYECEQLPKSIRMALLPYLLSNGYRLVHIEPRDWEEYCLTPLSLVTHPGSVFAEFFADDIPANFEYMIDQQHDDGSWTPNWSWAGEFPHSWQTAQTEIKAELTLRNLQQLDTFGRLCP